MLYESQQPVRLFRANRHGGYGDNEQVWIPEDLWHRLRLIAVAYRLHLLPLLDGSTDPVFLNRSQVETLVGETGFVHELVNDPLLRDHVLAIAQLAQAQGQGASKEMVGIEFP